MSDKTMPASTQASSTRKWTPRRRGACGMCKVKKIRCDGATPCTNCRKHDSECRYVHAKKRQSSKKSVGSVSSDKSPERPTQQGKMCNSTTDIRVEALNGIQPSPDLSMSSAGWATSLPTGFNNDLQGSTSNSDDQSTVRTLPDNDIDDATLNLDADQNGIHDLPLQPADVGNLGYETAISWQPLGKDNFTDWPLDFDMPDFDMLFPVDQLNQSTGVDAATMTELDKPQPWDQSTRSYNPTSSSGELMGYLSLNEAAVPTRGFPDPVPSVNFSLHAIFSAAHDRVLESISTPKQNEIDRIFKRISSVRAQLSVDLNDEQCNESYATWYWSDAALMESCKSACFQQPLGISNFMTRSYFENYIKETRGRSQGNPTLLSLIDSVMAYGYQAFLTTTQRFVSSDEREQANCYSRTALRSRDSILRSPPTLVKLQTLLAMMTVSEQIDCPICCELMTGAIDCARSLKLEAQDSMHNENMTASNRELAWKSLWFLYSVEVPISLRKGISPVLDHDWIDQAPPHVGKEIDWFPLQCLYATVLSSATKSLYKQSALRQSFVEREQSLEFAYNLLEGWRSQLPAPFQGIHNEDMRKVLDDHQTRHIALVMFRQYHEAIFMIFFPWTSSQADGKVSKEWRNKSMELCVNSAQAVLAIANQISSSDIRDSKFLELVSVSICMTFLDVASSSKANKSISYLSMGCGIFGRLNLDKEMPLIDVLELTRTAQQIEAQ